MPNPDIEPGSRIGHFRIISRLGAGGMGVVYRAIDERLGREVAIKRLPPEASADPHARARLLREAQSAAALNHPTVCTVHEVVDEAGGVHIAMELVEGRTLDHWRTDSHPPVEAIVRAAISIADALEHAHARGVIHRDLKPANVMMTTDGRIKVMDFGLARLTPTDGARTQVETAEMLTEPGSVVGTTSYMAPEVLRGNVCDVRGDIWSFGVVLYELLTGSTPFPGGTHFQIAAAILDRPFEPMPANVPEGLRAIVARCLEKDPTQRFHGAGEVRAALEQALVVGRSATLPTAVPAHTEPRPPRRWRTVLVGTTGLTLLAAIGIVGRERLAGCQPPSGTGLIRSLAVLPLENLSQDPDQAFFADGMTEELATRLAKIAALRVISSESVHGLVLQKRSLAEIGRALRVPAVVRGSVTRSGDRVRLNVQLVKAASGDLLWAESYDRRIADVLAMQSELALTIAREIQVQVTPEERSRLSNVSPVDPGAYDAYLRGRAAWGEYTLDGFRSAERHFRRSLELEPGYAPAWAGLADAAYGTSSMFVAPNIAIPQAREAAQKALELDPSLAEAHTSQGIVKLVYDWDWRGAEASFERAIALKPGDANAHLWRGHLLALEGHFEEGLAEIQHALDLDPLNTWVNVNLGWHLYYARRYEDAIAHLTKARDAEPENFLPRVFLGIALEQHGDHVQAVTELEEAVRTYPNNDNLAQLAHALGTAGRKAEALRIIDGLRERRRKTFVPAGDIALAYAGISERDSASHWLDLALEDHSESLIQLKVEPGFDPLRGDPRFVAVLRRVGLAK